MFLHRLGGCFGVGLFSYEVVADHLHDDSDDPGARVRNKEDVEGSVIRKNSEDPQDSGAYGSDYGEDHGDGGGGEGGENTGRSIFHMGFDGCTEGIFGTFHKIKSSTDMSMNLHATGEYIHTFYVYQLCTDYGKVTVGHFQYFSVSDEYGTVLEPTLRGQNTCVDKLSQHRI